LVPEQEEHQLDEIHSLELEQGLQDDFQVLRIFFQDFEELLKILKM
jgi:hypothetical protein